MEVPSEQGITEVLEGQLSLEQAIRRNVAGTGLDFISCGLSSSHPTEILGSQQMKEMIAKLKNEYDIILLDSPPYLAVADVAVLSEIVDSLIVVARYQRTDKRHLRNLKRRFSDPNIKELGVVINGVSVKEKDYYYHQYYYYGYGDRSPIK